MANLTVLAAAFGAWMVAGLEISLFVLIHRQMTLGLLGPDTPERVVTQWFAWFQAAFLFGAAAGVWVFPVACFRFVGHRRLRMLPHVDEPAAMRLEEPLPPDVARLCDY